MLAPAHYAARTIGLRTYATARHYTRKGRRRQVRKSTLGVMGAMRRKGGLNP
jgi:hypothetical protein